MRMYSFLTAAAFAMTSQVAFAACDLVSDGRGTISNDLFEKKNAPADSSAMANLLYGQLASRGPVLKQQCTAEQYITAFVRLNPSYAPDKPMLIPVLNATSVSAPPPETATAPAPVAAVDPAPQPAVSPAVREEQAQILQEQAGVQTQKDGLERAIRTFVNNNPVKVQWTEDQKKSFDDAQDKLAEYDRQIAALETRMTNLEAEMDQKADTTYVDEQNGTQDAAIAKNAKDIKNLQGKTGESLSWWQEYGIIGAIILSLLAALAAARAFFRKTPAPATDMGGVSDILMRADLDALKQEVEAVSTKVDAIDSRFTHTVKRVSDTPRPAALKALADREEFEYPLEVDGQLTIFKGSVVQHAASGDAVIKIDELSKPVTASKLFAELAAYIENGGQVPTLRAVN